MIGYISKLNSDAKNIKISVYTDVQEDVVGTAGSSFKSFYSLECIGSMNCCLIIIHIG